jgi:hypothetical protein
MSGYIEEIQNKGCWAIRILAFNDENEKYLGEAGCDAVVGAISRHIDNQEIQSYGSQAITISGGRW